MNGKRSTVVPAVLAIALAVVIISLGMYAGVPINSTAVSSQTQLQTSFTGSGAQSASQSQTQVQGSQPGTSSSSSSSPASPGSGEGTLTILLTDPPNIPHGVSKIYVTYSDLEVHVSGAGNQSGWTKVQSGGQIELLGTVNVSQTISSVKVAAGDYNALRFNISSALITYNSKNYTAFVQSAELFVPIIHGVPVNATGPTAALIDISPTVIDIGSPSTPEFIIRSVATAYPVPSTQVTTQMQQQGNKISLTGLGWWHKFIENQSANLVIGSAKLSAMGLGLDVTNNGNTTAHLTLVVVSPLVTPNARGYLPGSFFGTGVFSILPNGTLVQLRYMMEPTSAASLKMSVSSTVFETVGYNLTAGATASFSYSGPIHLGFLSANALQDAIVPGQQYVVTVIGTQSASSVVVVAS